MMKEIKLISLLLLLFILGAGCKSEDSLSVPPLQEQQLPDNPLDLYLYNQFQKEFNCVVRYRFVNRYVDDSKQVTPPEREVVEPYMDFLKGHWVDSYLESGTGSETLVRELFPAEIVLIGSPMFNLDGTVTLGTADAGVRITLTEVNDFDINDVAWKRSQLHVIQHEFSHIIHQRNDLPTNYQKISEGDYTGGSWINQTYPATLRLGFVTPYASNNPNEDFAELVSHLLTMPTDVFNDLYLDVTKDEFGNPWVSESAKDPSVEQGKELIQEKVDAIVRYYQEVLEIDFEELRANTLERLYPATQP